MACMNWLTTDYLLRSGFTVTGAPGQPRTATNGRITFRIEPDCDHPDCPPHTQTTPDAGADIRKAA
jgi:hypothetical protein